MSSPIAPKQSSWRSVALWAALLVATHAIAAPAAPAAPVKKKPVTAAKGSSVKSAAPAQRAVAGKGKPATKDVAAKKAAVPVAKSQDHAKVAKRPAASKASKVAPATATATATNKLGAGPARAVAAAPRPEPQLYIPPPLGPERYYPNGIPELRPEFMHQEPVARPQMAQEAVNPAFVAPQ